MDPQQLKENVTFTGMVQKRRAVKARLNRNNILKQKREKRLKTCSTENTPTANTNIVNDVQNLRPSLSQISPNIINQGTSSVQKNKSNIHTHSDLHSQQTSVSNTQCATTQTFISKIRQFSNIDNLEVNLGSFKATQSSSNDIQQTPSNDNSLFDCDSEEEFRYDDSEGINN
jgi:hypothetical protein